MPPDVSLSDLARVIRRIEAKTRRRPASRARTAEEVLGGELVETERGPVLLVRRRFDAAHRHGSWPLAEAGDMPAAPLGVLARSGGAPPDPRRLLFLDTETTGLAGGTGTYAFLVGLGFFDGPTFEVRQYFMRDLDEEPALLTALEEAFRGFEGFVTYNGRGFDLPLLETRFVLARRRFPGETFHVDLLGPARALWGGSLADCRLGTLERAVLGFDREDDLPGALIPAAYFEYLRRKSPETLPRIFDHNRHDILSLAALAGWVAGALARAPAPGLGAGELVGLGRIWEGADPERAAGCYRMALDLGLPSPWRERLLLRLAGREKRLRRWDEACRLWTAAARAEQGFDPRPWEEIAKVHEHRWRDPAAARGVVEEALRRAQRSEAPERVLGAFAHRLDRLSRRLARLR